MQDSGESDVILANWDTETYRHKIEFPRYERWHLTMPIARNCTSGCDIEESSLFLIWRRKKTFPNPLALPDALVSPSWQLELTCHGDWHRNSIGKKVVVPLGSGVPNKFNIKDIIGKMGYDNQFPYLLPKTDSRLKICTRIIKYNPIDFFTCLIQHHPTTNIPDMCECSAVTCIDVKA